MKTHLLHTQFVFFDKAEKNYSAFEKQLAIVWETIRFWIYSYGKKLKKVSDHKPLTCIVSVEDPGSRLMRWRIQL